MVIAAKNIENTHQIAVAQQLILNHSNLTYLNNPSKSLGEILNGSITLRNSSDDAENSLPAPM